MNIEILEARIAPAGFSTTFTDVDGDLVTIKVSKGTLLEAAIVKTGSGPLGGEQLQALRLNHADFTGAAVSITAKPQKDVNGVLHGDGSVNVGLVSGNVALGSILVTGDLGQFVVSGSLGSVTVGSMGRFGTTTGAATIMSGADSIGKITIRTDLDQASISAPDGIGSVVLGGSLIGGAAAQSGSIIASNGAIGSVKVGGDLRGGSGDHSAQIAALRSIKSVTINGSVYGGASNQDTGTTLTGQIHGNILGSVKILGSLVGGSGARGAQIISPSTIGSITIGGSLVGGTSFDAGSIISSTSIGSIKIVGDVKGGSAQAAGRIHGNTDIGSLAIGGSLIGGTAEDAGEVFANGKFSEVTIGGNIVGGDASGNSSFDGAGYVQGGSLLSVTVLGSIIAGTNSGSGLLTSSGAIRADHDLGTVVVKGSLVGNVTNSVIIAGLGQATKTKSDLAIKSVSVIGSVFFTEILAGYNDDNTTSTRGVATDGNAQIGTVKIGGDFTSSNLVAGVTSGTDAFFGDANDAAIAGGDATIFSSIASVTIKGQALGSIASADAARFGIVAQSLGSVKIGAVKIPLLALHGTDTFASGKAQILGPSLGTFNADGFDLHAFEV